MPQALLTTQARLQEAVVSGMVNISRWFPSFVYCYVRAQWPCAVWPDEHQVQTNVFDSQFRHKDTHRQVQDDWPSALINGQESHWRRFGDANSDVNLHGHARTGRPLFTSPASLCVMRISKPPLKNVWRMYLYIFANCPCSSWVWQKLLTKYGIHVMWCSIIITSTSETESSTIKFVS